MYKGEMKSSRYPLPTWGIWAVVCILLGTVDVTSAGNIGEVLGIAIGVSLVTSVITTILTILCIYGIKRTLSKGKRLDRDTPVRDSHTSSTRSTRPLTSTTRGQYEPVSTIEKQPNQNGEVKQRSRIKSDFIARWCTEQNLTEHTASVLRDNGFTTKETVLSMRIEDIPRLGLQSLGQECLLRDAVMLKGTHATTGLTLTQRQRSNSVEDIPQSPYSPSDHERSGGSSGVFERAQSMDQVDGTAQVGRPLIVSKKKSMGSMEIIEDDNRGDTTIIIRSPLTNPEGPGLIHHTVQPQRKQSNPKNFQGLLSDTGLYELSRMIGAEWNHLATLLNVPQPIQQQLQMDHPKNVRQQISEMLRLWRDTAQGTKESIKGQLHKALVATGRTDLAEDLLQEQVDGSSEKVAYHSIV